MLPIPSYSTTFYQCNQLKKVKSKNIEDILYPINIPQKLGHGIYNVGGRGVGGINK